MFLRPGVGIAGGTQIGDYCQVGGQAGIYGHLTLSANVVVAANPALRDRFDNTQLMGIPARPAREFLRETAPLKRLGKSSGKPGSGE